METFKLQEIIVGKLTNTFFIVEMFAIYNNTQMFVAS